MNNFQVPSPRLLFPLSNRLEENNILTLNVLGEEACLSLIFCIACWIICEGTCQGQSFCKNNGCD